MRLAVRGRFSVGYPLGADGFFVGSIAMSKPMQVYYSAVLGALGGLLGWWIVGSVPTGAWNVWLAYPLVGAGLGLWIGGCVAATDGAVIKRSVRPALRDGLRGALAGAAAGIVGLLLAELSFLGVGAGF